MQQLSVERLTVKHAIKSINWKACDQYMLFEKYKNTSQSKIDL